MKKSTEDIYELFAESGKKLAQLVASSAFEFWQRPDFRLYVDFPNIDQTEQDRIFNELEVSILGLFSLQLEHKASVLEENEGKVLMTFQKELIHGFIQMMEDVGIEKKFLKQWEKLINMRLKEYRGDFKIALSESSSWEEFKDDDQTRHTWARIETITIDCLSHIRRGDVKEGDPLWKLLRKWFITIDTILHPIAHTPDEKQKS